MSAYIYTLLGNITEISLVGDPQWPTFLPQGQFSIFYSFFVVRCPHVGVVDQQPTQVGQGKNTKPPTNPCRLGKRETAECEPEVALPLWVILHAALKEREGRLLHQAKAPHVNPTPRATSANRPYIRY